MMGPEQRPSGPIEKPKPVVKVDVLKVWQKIKQWLQEKDK